MTFFLPTIVGERRIHIINTRKEDGTTTYVAISTYFNTITIVPIIGIDTAFVVTVIRDAGMLQAVMISKHPDDKHCNMLRYGCFVRHAITIVEKKRTKDRNEDD